MIAKPLLQKQHTHLPQRIDRGDAHIAEKMITSMIGCSIHRSIDRGGRNVIAIYTLDIYLRYPSKAEGHSRNEIHTAPRIIEGTLPYTQSIAQVQKRPLPQ